MQILGGGWYVLGSAFHGNTLPQTTSNASGQCILRCYTLLAMEPLSPPTARELYAHLGQGREIMRMILILFLFAVAGFCFFRPPWHQDGSLMTLALQAGLVASLVGLGFWQVKKHEAAEERAWRMAWMAKLDASGSESAMATLRHEKTDAASAKIIREWMALRIQSIP
jgi:hypothetical protein